MTISIDHKSRANIDPGTALEFVARITDIAERHESRGNIKYAMNLPDRIAAILRDERETTVKALSGASRFRDDLLTYLRAMSMILTMTGNASTHAEKGARLRGAIELIESVIRTLQEMRFEATYTNWSHVDVFASDYPTRHYVERIHELERELEDYKKNRP